MNTDTCVKPSEKIVCRTPTARLRSLSPAASRLRLMQLIWVKPGTVTSVASLGREIRVRPLRAVHDTVGVELLHRFQDAPRAAIYADGQVP